jgi:hypothetical protein
LIHNVAIVSASDDSYFYYLKGLVCSILDKTESGGVSIYVIDGGLTDEQRQWLNVRNVRVRDPHWPYAQVDASAVVGALITRPAIPILFPGHDVYMWMDADVWVQRWDAVTACVNRATAVSPHLSPIPPSGDVGASLGSQTSEDQLVAAGSGVFAARADSPLWDRWRTVVEERFRSLESDEDLCRLDCEAFRAACGDVGLADVQDCWRCSEAIPAITLDATTLVDPATHLPIGIVHMDGDSKRRFVRLARTDGHPIARLMTYHPCWRRTTTSHPILRTSRWTRAFRG